MSDGVADAKDTGREVTASERIVHGRVFDLVRETVRLDDETAVTRDYLRHPGAVAALALREDAGGEAEILLIRQYRHPVRAMLWEIPAGLLDVVDEDPLTAARRELAEEADLTAGRWDVLVDWFSTPGGSDESVRVYLARDLAEVPEADRHRRVDEERDMETRWVPLEEAVAAVHAGLLHNAAAVVGVLATANARARDWEPLRPAGAPWLR